MKKLILILTVLALFCCALGFASCQKADSPLNIDTLPETLPYVPTPLDIEFYDNSSNVIMTPFQEYPPSSTTKPNTSAPDTTPDTSAPDTTPDTSAPDTTPDTSAPDTTTPDTTAPTPGTPVVV